jgi:hypothetical protein
MRFIYIYIVAVGKTNLKYLVTLKWCEWGWLALCLCWKQSMHLSSLHRCVTLSYVICDCCEDVLCWIIQHVFRFKREVWSKIVQNMLRLAQKHQWPIFDYLVDRSCNKHLWMDEQYQLHKKCPLIEVFTQATIDDWMMTFEIVKIQCSHDTISLIFELEQQFPI